MGEEREGPLARWSRLKRRSGSARSGRRGGAAPVTVANVDPGFPAASAREGGVPAVAPGDDAAAGEGGDAARDLPPVDGLDKDSDYTPFLGDGVPEKLARAAMRKLWRSDPIFAFRDGLDDYDEDFSIMQTVAEAFAGKGGKAKAKKTKGKAKPATAKAKAKKSRGRAEVKTAGTKEGKAKQKKKTAARKGPRAGEEEKA